MSKLRSRLSVFLFVTAMSQVLAAPSALGADIGFRAAASSGANAGTLNMAINKPAGTAATDFMVAGITISPATATITPPSGWLLLRRLDNGTNSLAIYRKAASATEPASYTWRFSNSSGSAGGIATFTGVSSTTPIDVESGASTPSSTRHAAPSVTPTLPGTMLVTWHAFSSSATWTPPAGMTEVVDRASEAAPNTNGVSLEGNTLFLTTAAATGAMVATASNNADVGNTVSLALRPN
jgi:MSHA biogenesis protein MshQ